MWHLEFQLLRGDVELFMDNLNGDVELFMDDTSDAGKRRIAVSAAAAISFKEFPRMIDKVVWTFVGNFIIGISHNTAFDISSPETAERACSKKSDGFKLPRLGIRKSSCNL